MRLKKIISLAITSAIILLMVPIITADLNIVEAAKGGAKLNMPNLSKSSVPKNNLNKMQSSTNPKPAQNPANKTPAASSAESSKSVSGGGNTYTPSKSAKDLPNNTPTAKSNAAANTAAQSSAGFGNTLRNIGLFASGMMLGGFLGSLFGGLGGGFLGDVFGLLFNFAIFYAIYRGGRYLWNRYRNGNQTKNKVQDYQPIDITPPQAMNYPNHSSLGTDYDPRRTAEYYRSR